MLEGVTRTTAVHICFGYEAIILGVIHLSTPETEPVEVVAGRVRRAFDRVPPERIVIATDCGMKYLPRGRYAPWPAPPACCEPSSAAAEGGNVRNMAGLMPWWLPPALGTLEARTKETPSPHERTGK
ncbi:hypothetical protein [Nonomuraea sp. SYSU D8015]|uniref:hypothetical protein n=1 Tax=Nonomuraea sp. SYSU D8015 TaxID=2593644 RepID=UPI001CB7318A|nr:hypothetical protein [Nonomuraea sp. SYSU D8015]